MQTHKILSLVLLLILLEIGILAGTHFFSSASQGTPPEMSLSAYAETILAKCRGADYPSGCYEQEVPRLMNTLSMEDAFEVTRLITQEDQGFRHCHVLAHNLSARETAKDPARWKDVVARCPATLCNNGCPHGALMERFQNEVEVLSSEQIELIKPDLEDVCDARDGWQPSKVERAMCYHGIGHLNMYITGANIEKSVELCEEIGVKEDGKNYVQTCTDGVFMSIFQPLDPEDVALVQDIVPDKEYVHTFCKQYGGESFHACHRESWPLFYKEIQSPEGLTDFCSYTDDPVGRKDCYTWLMGVLTLVYVPAVGSLDELKNFCVGLPEDIVPLCFAHVAVRVVQIDPRSVDRAAQVCEVAKTVHAGDVCFEMLSIQGERSFQSRPQEQIQYCRTLPEEWQKVCLREIS